MTPEEIIAKGRDVIRIEANAVNGLIEHLDENFVNAVKTILNCKGRVVLTGMGKSGLIARKVVATLNSTGTPAIYMHPTDALHGDLGMVRSDDVAIVLSKSGTTEEIANLVTLIKRLKAPVIGMVSDLNSKIAREVDIVLYIPIKEEACPHDLAPTASTTATLAMGDALSVVLLELRGFTPEDFAMLHPGGSLGKRLSLRVEEIMIKGNNIPIVNVATPLKDAIIEITSKRLGVTSVVNDDGKLAGIITDGDLRRLLERTLDIKELKASDIMTKNPKVISSDILASRALQIMENFKITSLIVADENRKPVGIVHLHDLVNLGLKLR